MVEFRPNYVKVVFPDCHWSNDQFSCPNFLSFGCCWRGEDVSNFVCVTWHNCCLTLPKGDVATFDVAKSAPSLQMVQLECPRFRNLYVAFNFEKFLFPIFSPCPFFLPSSLSGSKWSILNAMSHSLLRSSVSATALSSFPQCSNKKWFIIGGKRKRWKILRAKSF